MYLRKCTEIELVAEKRRAGLLLKSTGITLKKPLHENRLWQLVFLLIERVRSPPNASSTDRRGEREQVAGRRRRGRRREQQAGERQAAEAVGAANLEHFKAVSHLCAYIGRQLAESDKSTAY